MSKSLNYEALSQPLVKGFNYIEFIDDALIYMYPEIGRDMK